MCIKTGTTSDTSWHTKFSCKQNMALYFIKQNDTGWVLCNLRNYVVPHHVCRNYKLAAVTRLLARYYKGRKIVNLWKILGIILGS